MLDQGKQTLSVRFLRGAFLCLMRILFRIEHRGMQNIPPEGPLLIVANHETYCDPFWISVRVYRAVRYMAWDKIFQFPVAGSIFRWFGAFPVSLDNPESSSVKAALKILGRGEALTIFPEGGRSPDGRLMPFKQGAARLAMKTGATILPVAIQGGGRVWGPKLLFPRPGKIRVTYLEPIRKEQFENSAAGLTRQIRSALLRVLEAD